MLDNIYMAGKIANAFIAAVGFLYVFIVVSGYMTDQIIVRLKCWKNMFEYFFYRKKFKEWLAQSKKGERL